MPLLPVCTCTSMAPTPASWEKSRFWVSPALFARNAASQEPECTLPHAKLCGDPGRSGPWEIGSFVGTLADGECMDGHRRIDAFPNILPKPWSKFEPLTDAYPSDDVTCGSYMHRRMTQAFLPGSQQQTLRWGTGAVAGVAFGAGNCLGSLFAM